MELLGLTFHRQGCSFEAYRGEDRESPPLRQLLYTTTAARLLLLMLLLLLRQRRASGGKVAPPCRLGKKESDCDGFEANTSKFKWGHRLLPAMIHHRARS